MENTNEDKITHLFPANQQGKGVKLNIQIDPNNLDYSERMGELFKEVSDSNPESIADFLIRLNEINKL